MEGGDVVGDTSAERHCFQQRVGGQPVGAMRAGGSNLSASPEPVDRATALRVRVNAAHVVMRRRGHGDWLARRIDAGRPASGKHRRKMLGEFSAKKRAAIEEGATSTHDLAING